MKSEISWKTRPELHLCCVEEGTAWRYRDDGGTLALLDSTHMLVVEYCDGSTPASVVALHVHNDTDESIELEVSSNGNATVTPTGPQTVDAHGTLTWLCGHSGGESCDCSALGGTCKCGSWNITGSSRHAMTIPDPTFKVRWQAHGEPPSSP
jgi:hypothetical protein